MHLNCSCPSCVGIVRADYYITSPYYNGEAWQGNKPKRKSRRITLLRAAWQHVPVCADWVYPMHTILHSQFMIRLDVARGRASYVAPVTTQGRLTSIE